jgi:murein DD-endopeptidase MepM/ murein hydrolase activator NlpD
MALTLPISKAAATTTGKLVLAATVAAAALVAPTAAIGPAPRAQTPVAARATAGDETPGGGTVLRPAGDLPEASALVDLSWPTARSGSAADAYRGRWLWPLQPRPVVLRRFEAPATRYGRGHRGIDLAAKAGQGVQSVDAGVVAHAGNLAGRGTITLVHASGLRSTYEPVRATVRVGDVVGRGAPIGVVEPVLGHCGESSCLHIGALRGDVYLDPLPLIMARVILLPVPTSW